MEAEAIVTDWIKEGDEEEGATCQALQQHRGHTAGHALGALNAQAKADAQCQELFQ